MEYKCWFLIRSVILFAYILGVTGANDNLEQCLATQEHSSCQRSYDPRSPLVNCSFLPQEFLDCEEPVDHKGNRSAREELGHGCVKFGGQRYEDVEKTSVRCTVLPGIECIGDRNFLREGFSCIKYSGHYFATTLLYSLLLGFLGMDRFCLGHTGTAVGKLLTMGGVGVWWVVDLALLCTGGLGPEDGSNWMPFV